MPFLYRMKLTVPDASRVAAGRIDASNLVDRKVALAKVGASEDPAADAIAKRVAAEPPPSDGSSFRQEPSESLDGVEAVEVTEPITPRDLVEIRQHAYEQIGDMLVHFAGGLDVNLLAITREDDFTFTILVDRRVRADHGGFWYLDDGVEV